MRRPVPDASHQADKPQSLVIDQNPQPVTPSVVAVLVRDEPGQPFHRELVEVVEHRGRVPVPEIGTPSDQEPIQVPYDVLDGQHQQPSGGVGPETILEPSDRALRGPSTQKVPSLAGEALHPAMVETSGSRGALLCPGPLSGQIRNFVGGVCPESCAGLAGGSPVGVAAKRPRSWWPAEGET